MRDSSGVLLLLAPAPNSLDEPEGSSLDSFNRLKFKAVFFCNMWMTFLLRAFSMVVELMDESLALLSDGRAESLAGCRSDLEMQALVLSLAGHTIGRWIDPAATERFNSFDSLVLFLRRWAADLT